MVRGSRASYIFVSLAWATATNKYFITLFVEQVHFEPYSVYDVSVTIKKIFEEYCFINAVKYSFIDNVFPYLNF